MRLLGIFHGRAHMEARGTCDAPCVELGAHALAAADMASSADVLACADGRMRNAGELARELGLPEDAEQARVTLAAYQTWGERYYERVEGPVLTAVIDRARDRMVLARDRMGERRAFYVAENGGAAFSNHPDVLLEAGAARPVIDADGLNELFALGPARTPGKTPWRDMRALEPGCALVVDGNGAGTRRYFCLEAREHGRDAEESARDVREILERAVGEIASLRPAAMLSGGVDSTALTALLRRRIEPVESFSVDYEGNARHFRGTAFQPERDEPYIELAVERIGTAHHRVLLAQAELAGALGEAVDARGFPGMADVDSSLLLFAGRIAPHARYALSGECGDEVFGGYPWFRDARSLNDEAFPWSGSLDLRMGILKKRVRDKLRPERYVRDRLHEAVDRVRHLPGEDAGERCLRTMQHLCFEFFMPNLQERAAAMCAQHGLEVLTPFCDERLAQYVYNVPWEIKFLRGREKGLLREALTGVLPDTLRYRKKSPYPKTCDPEYARLTAEMTRALLADRTNPILSFVDAEALARMAGSTLSAADAPWFGQLMAGPQMLGYLWQANEWMRARRAEVSL